MRFIVPLEPGKLVLNYTFLPTFIGMNSALRTKMEKVLAEKIVGLPWTESTFDLANDVVIEYVQSEFGGLPGLKDYLEAIKFVSVA